MLFLRNLPVLPLIASSWPNYHLLVLAHAALLAVHAVLACLLLLACSTLACLLLQLSVIAYWLILWLNDSIFLVMLMLTCAVAHLSYLDLL